MVRIVKCSRFLDIMEIIGMITITLLISSAIAKKKYSYQQLEPPISSAESFEKLLYYKDCKHNKKETTSIPEPLRKPIQKQPQCPCPKMCCSICCECTEQPFIGRQMAPLQQQASMANMAMMMNNNIEPMQVAPQPQRHPMPVQPQIVQRGGKKKKKAPKPDAMLQPPIGGRRDFGFTRENIKTLISKDQDIKKILKDLVRVTMHKVDLVEKVKAQRTSTADPIADDDDYNEN